MNSFYPTSSEDKTLAGVMYLLCLFPVVSFFGPLIIWLVKRESSSFIDDHGKQILNFQILMFIGGLVSVLLSFIFIGGILGTILFLANVVLSILGAVKAFIGEEYKYPINLKILK